MRKSATVYQVELEEADKLVRYLESQDFLIRDVNISVGEQQFTRKLIYAPHISLIANNLAGTLGKNINFYELSVFATENNPLETAIEHYLNAQGTVADLNMKIG